MRESSALQRTVPCSQRVLVASLVLALSALLVATPAWTQGGSFSGRPSSRAVELDLARGGSRDDSRLAPPRELSAFDLGTGNNAYLIPAEGTTLVVSAASGRLVRWINLLGSNMYGLLEPRVVLSHFQVHQDLMVVTLEYSYRRIHVTGPPRPDYLSSFVGICRTVSGIPAADCQQVDVWQADAPEAAREDVFATVRSVQEARPVRYASGCLRIRDHDDDGYRDLILERRWWEASEKAEPATVSPEADFLWLRFDPEQQRFLAGRPVTDIEPSEDLSCTGPDPAGTSSAGSPSG